MKKIVIVALVLLVLLVAAPLAIGRLAESRVNAGLDKMIEQVPYLSIVERQWTSGWFRSEQVVTFEMFGAWADLFDPRKVMEEMAREVGAEVERDGATAPDVETEDGAPSDVAPDAGSAKPERLRFTVRNEILHGPILWPASLGLARVNVRPVLSEKLRQDLIDVFGTDEPVRISHRVGFFGGGATRFFADGRTIELDAGGKWVYDDFDMTVGHSADFDEYDVDGRWPKVEFSKDGEQVVLRGISIEGESERIVGDVFDADAEFKIASMTFVGKDRIETHVDDVHYIVDTDHEGDFLDFEARVGSGKVRNQGLTELHLEIKGIHYDFTFRHLHVGTLDKLTAAVKESYTQPVATLADAEARIFEPMKEHGLALLKYEPVLSVDRVGLETPEGEAVIKGTVRLEGVSDADFPPSAALFEKLAADLTIEVAQKLLDKIPNGATSAGMAVDQGFAKREGDKLVSRIEYRNGTLTVNGQAVPIPGLGGPPAGEEGYPEAYPEEPEE